MLDSDWLIEPLPICYVIGVKLGGYPITAFQMSNNNSLKLNTCNVVVYNYRTFLLPLYVCVEYLFEVSSLKYASCVHSQDFCFSLMFQICTSWLANPTSSLYKPTCSFDLSVCDPSKCCSYSSCFGFKREPHFPNSLQFLDTYEIWKKHNVIM